ncbi:MAG: C-GCAxxG-C-C family protein [Cyclobacteriaceae bacterium]|nr:C-GCAxxG-C-C family protein [Cyclobacteriaceae bacterium]
MARLNRRGLFKAAGIAGAGYVASVFTGFASAGSDSPSTAPWIYHPLDADHTASLAYEIYPGRGCMYSVFKSIVGQLADNFGAPYNQFPFDMLQYGHGGAGSYGSLCGTLNGGAAAIGLFCNDKKTSDQMISHLFKWYEESELPVFVPEKPLIEDEIPTVITESVICHASISRWCMKAACSPDDPMRTERCMRLSADIAAKTVEILNAYADKHVVAFALDAKSEECMTCHGKEEAKMYKSKAKTSCGSCHGDPHVPAFQP